jgi:hypothetical protein
VEGLKIPFSLRVSLFRIGWSWESGLWIPILLLLVDSWQILVDEFRASWWLLMCRPLISPPLSQHHRQTTASYFPVIFLRSTSDHPHWWSCRPHPTYIILKKISTVKRATETKWASIAPSISDTPPSLYCPWRNRSAALCCPCDSAGWYSHLFAAKTCTFAKRYKHSRPINDMYCMYEKKNTAMRSVPAILAARRGWGVNSRKRPQC